MMRSRAGEGKQGRGCVRDRCKISAKSLFGCQSLPGYRQRIVVVWGKGLIKLKHMTLARINFLAWLLLFLSFISDRFFEQKK